MAKGVWGAAALCAALAVAGCQGTEFSKSPLLSSFTTGAQKPAVMSGPVPSPYLLSVIKDAAPDPVAAVPEKLPVPSRANDFNTGILKRTLTLMGGGKKSYSGIQQGSAKYYTHQDWYIAASLASFNLPREAKAFVVNPEDKLSLPEICARPRAGDTIATNCTNAANEMLAAALSRQIAGDTATAEKFYQRVIRDDKIILAWMKNGTNCYTDTRRFGGYADALQLDCSEVYALRALYEGMAGRPQTMVGTLIAGETLVPKIRDIEELPFITLFPRLGEQLRLRGQLRLLATMANLIYDAYPKLGYIDVTQSLLDEIDAQTNSAHGLPAAVNLLAIAARAPKVYLQASKDFLPEIGMALDCRAAAIGARSPETLAEATKQFDDILARFQALGESNNTAYCLYQMAPVVGRTDKRARILAVLKKEREKQAAPIEQRERKDYADELKIYKDFITAGEHYDTAHQDELDAYIRALQKSAGPWILYAIDDEEYKQAMLEILDTSKNLHVLSSKRGDLYTKVTYMAIWNESHRAN